MKPTLSERLSASLYEPEKAPYDPIELKGLLIQMVANILIGAPILLAWAFVFIYFFSEIESFIGFAGYAVFDLVLLALMSIRRMRATWVRSLYLSVHLAATFFYRLVAGRNRQFGGDHILCFDCTICDD